MKHLKLQFEKPCYRPCFSTGLGFQALISGTFVLPSHFPPRALSSMQTSGLGNPMGRSLSRLKTWLIFKGFMVFGFFWLSEQLTKENKKAVSFGSVEGEEEGKNIQGHQLLFILCSNSNQLPVCWEVWG